MTIRESDVKHLVEAARAHFKRPNLQLVFEPWFEENDASFCYDSGNIKWKSAVGRPQADYPFMDLVYSEGRQDSAKGYITLIEQGDVSYGYVSRFILLPLMKPRANETNLNWRMAQGSWFDVVVEPKPLLRGRGRLSDRDMGELFSGEIYKLSKLRLGDFFFASDLGSMEKAAALRDCFYTVGERDAGIVRTIAETHHRLVARWLLFKTHGAVVAHCALSCGQNYVGHAFSSTLIRKI